MTEEERERLAHEADIVQGFLLQAQGMLATLEGQSPCLATTYEYRLTKRWCVSGAIYAGRLAASIRNETESM